MSTLNKLFQTNLQTTNERLVISCRILLKILEKLSNTYCGWIKKDTMLGIVKTLTNIFRYLSWIQSIFFAFKWICFCRFTESCLAINNYPAQLIKFINLNLLFMVDPFLDVLLQNDSFRMVTKVSLEFLAVTYHDRYFRHFWNITMTISITIYCFCRC